jgi:hypothetical protein
MQFVVMEVVALGLMRRMLIILADVGGCSGQVPGYMVLGSVAMGRNRVLESSISSGQKAGCCVQVSTESRIGNADDMFEARGDLQTAGLRSSHRL